MATWEERKAAREARIAAEKKEEFNELCQKIAANDPDIKTVNFEPLFSNNLNEAAIQLGSALRSNSMVTKFCLSEYSDFTGLVDPILLHAIPSNGKINTFRFGKGNFTPFAFTECLRLLRGSLRTLSLRLHRSYDASSNQDAEQQAHAILSLSRLETLEIEMDASIGTNADFHFASRFFRALCSRAASKSHFRNNLKRFHFRYLRGPPQDVSRSSLLARDLLKLIKSTPVLEELHLVSCRDNAFDDTAFDIIARGIDVHPRLHTVRLPIHSLQQLARLIEILQRNRNITTLSIVFRRATYIDPRGSSLLDVSNVLETLADTRHPLESLRVSAAVNRSDTEIFIKGHEKLGEILPRLEKLKTLDLNLSNHQRTLVYGGCWFPDGSVRYKSYIVNGLLDNIPANEFVNSIISNKSLTCFKLSWGNEIEVDGQQVVTQAIEFTTTRNRSNLTKVPYEELPSALHDVLTTKYTYAETAVSVVYAALREREDWKRNDRV